MAGPEMFQQTVELETGEQTPGTMHVVPRLRLLPSVVIVEKLVKDPSPLW